MFCVFRSILQELEVAPEGSGKPMEAWSKQNTYKILRAEI